MAKRLTKFGGINKDRRAELRRHAVQVASMFPEDPNECRYVMHALDKLFRGYIEDDFPAPAVKAPVPLRLIGG